VTRRAPLRRTERSLWSRVSRSGPALRLLLWLALLLAVAVSIWAVVSAHRVRVRGLPSRFPSPVSEANVPALGVNVALHQVGDDSLRAALSRAAEGGFVWIRQSFSWSQIRDADSPAGFDWSGVDRVVDALDDYPELRLVAVLGDDPPVPPEDPDQFAAFAAAFAERYGQRVDYYQVWDEPNLAAQWGGGLVNPVAYGDLLARTADAVRAADPDARILLAGLAPTMEATEKNLSDVRYLERLYEAGAASSFDIVAAKPYGFDTGPGDRRVDESLLNVSRILLLREVMVAHGDADKAIWASHWGWNALPDGWTGAPSIWGQTDEATQAARSVAMLERAREEWPWMGAMIIENLQPGPAPSSSVEGLRDPRWGFSLLAPDGTPRPVYRALADWAQAQPAAASVGGYPARNPWAAYEGSWRAGPLGAGVAPSAAGSGEETSPQDAVQGRASFRFRGTRAALTVRRGPYRGFLYVTVDGEPANALPRDERDRSYVVLYDKRASSAVVPLATGLEPGVHTVAVTAQGGEGRWPLVDWRVGAPPVHDGTAWKLAGLAAAALALSALVVRDLRRVRWRDLAHGFLQLPPAAQAALAIGATALLWTAAGVSWSRLPPETVLSALCLALSLSMLPVLACLFALRLDLGLALIVLSAPFYLVPEGMVYRALSLPEVLVLLASAAYVVRRAGPLGASPAMRGDDVSADEGGGRGGLHLITRLSALPSTLDGAVLMLLLAAGIASVAAADHLAALFELRSVFLLPALYYALLRLIPLDRRARQRILGGFLVGGVGVALVGLIQLVLGWNLVAAEGGLLRLQSVYHSPNSVGLYLGRVWPFLVVGVVWGRTAGRRRLSALALVLVTTALVLSFSRGALLLALPASVLAMGWWAGGRYRWAALVLVAAGALALVPLLSLPRFAALLDLRRGTTFFRLQLWRSSLRMIRDHPLFGVGPGNFLEAYRTRYVLPAAWEEFNLEHAHNILLDHWTRLGVLGVAAGCAVQVAFWRSLWRRGRGALVLGLVGSMAALLAHGLVDNALFFPDLALTFFMLLALAQTRSQG